MLSTTQRCTPPCDSDTAPYRCIDVRRQRVAEVLTNSFVLRLVAFVGFNPTDIARLVQLRVDEQCRFVFRS